MKHLLILLVVMLATATSLCTPAFAAAAGTSLRATSPAPLVVVEGRVLDASQSPVANARVGIFSKVNPDNAPCPRSVKPESCLEYLFSISADRAHAVTGEDGRYTLQVPGGFVFNSDTLWVEGVNSRGERLRTFRSIDACCGIRALLENIVLQQVADFTALIQHEGKPVAGAQVRIGEQQLGDPQQTDATGSVTTHRNLTPPNLLETVFMVVRADGFVTSHRNGTLAPGTTTQVVELTRESTLTGRIVGPAGKPLAHATLTAVFVRGKALVPVPVNDYFPLYWDPVAGTARTDDAGRFVLHGLRADQSYRLLIDAAEPSIAGSERLVTAGSGPIEIALNKAVPVTLAISGLHGPRPPADGQSASSKAADAAFDKIEIERYLSKQPELMQGPSAVFGSGISPTILIEWLDPNTGAWLPVFSPRKVTVKSATRADLRFAKVPVGTIRVSSTGQLQIVAETFDPVTIRAGRPIAIPVQVTALQQVEVKVTRDGEPAGGLVVEVNPEAEGLGWYGKTGREGSFTLMASPREDVKIKIMEADKVVATASIRPDAKRPETLVVDIRLEDY